MAVAASTELLGVSTTKTDTVACSLVAANAWRLDASAFLTSGNHIPGSAIARSGVALADIADVFTVYIQTPLLHYVTPFAHSLPYLTTSELGEYQTAQQAHVSLLTDPRLIEWQIKRDTIVLSRSGRVGEAYWVDKKLADTLVGDSFRVVPRNKGDGYFLFALLSSPYARDYVSGVTYGSVVDHASVEQVRSLPVPAIADHHRARISELVRRAVFAREAAYALQEAAEATMLRANALIEHQFPESETFDPLGQPECFAVDAKSVGQPPNGDGSEHRLDAHFYNGLAQLAVAGIRKCSNEVKTLGRLAEQVLMAPRFKRNYVEANYGVPFLSGKNIVQIRPTDLRYLSALQMADMPELVVKRGWTLVTCSGTIGRTCFVWKNYEDYAASQHIIRVIPDESNIDPGYLYAFLSSRYGYAQILRYRHGSVIDEVTDTQIEQVLVPFPSPSEQAVIGDLVREAYEKRAEAIRLEDEAKVILMKELINASGIQGA